MSDDYKSEIYDKLQHIRTSFIQKNMQESPFFGAFASDTFATDSLPGRLFKGYTSGFNLSYAPSVRTGVTDATIATGITYRSDFNGSTYTQIPPAPPLRRRSRRRSRRRCRATSTWTSTSPACSRRRLRSRS